MKKIVYVILIIICIVRSSFFITSAEENNIEIEPYLTTSENVLDCYSDAVILMDAKTGEVLFQKNALKKEYPASITKCMTSLLAIEDNRLDDLITYSDNAVYNVDSGSSNAGINAGEKLTVDESLYAAMLESANEACNALAEKSSGNLEAFVAEMNQKADELGCQNTHFCNANGLYDKNHYTCAYDMARIVREALNNDAFRKYTGTIIYESPKKDSEGKTQYWRNHHALLNKDYLYDDSFFVVEGGKTGYTDRCKNTLVTYAKSKNSDMELICVVMRCKDYVFKNGRSFSRVYDDTINLLNYGFNNFYTASLGMQDIENEEDLKELDYVQKVYKMLQPVPFISFKLEHDCEIVVANDFDSKSFETKVEMKRNDKTHQYGTFEWLYNKKIVETVPIEYELNKSFISEVYKSRNDKLKCNFNVIYLVGVLVIVSVIIAGFIFKRRYKRKTRGWKKYYKRHKIKYRW